MAIQKLFSSRANGTNGATFVGERGHIFYDETVGQLRLSDGTTAGGVPIVVASTTANLGNLYVAGTTISAITNNADVNLASNGTGNVNLVGSLRILTSSGYYSTTPVLSSQAGVVTVNGNLVTNGNAITNGLSYFNGAVTFVGTTVHQGSISTTGNLTTTGNLVVNGPSYFIGDTTRTGNTTQTGNLTVNGAQVNNGTTTFNGNVNQVGNLTITGQTTNNGLSVFNGNLNVTGNTQMVGNVVQQGNLTITGYTINNGTSVFNGQNNFNGNLNILGNTTVTGNTFVTGNTYVTGNTFVTGNTYVTGNTFVTGTTTVTGNTTVTGQITTITGNTYLTGNSFITGAATVTGPTTVTGNVTVTGNMLQSGQSIFNITQQNSVQGAVEITGDANAQWQTPVNTGVMLQVTGQANNSDRVYFDSLGSYSVLVGRRFEGTMASPTGVQGNVDMFRVGGSAYNSTGWSNIGPARMSFVTNEIQTATNQGGRIEFWTTANSAGPAYSTISRTATIDPVLGVTATGFVTAGNITAGNITVTNNETVGGNVTVTRSITANTLYAGAQVVTSGGIRTISGGTPTITLNFGTDSMIMVYQPAGTVTLQYGTLVAGSTITVSINLAAARNIVTGVSASNNINLAGKTNIGGGGNAPAATAQSLVSLVYTCIDGTAGNTYCVASYG